jgi:hypothetical protein
MNITEHYDLIIIGTAGGGTLAYRLAPTGKRFSFWSGATFYLEKSQLERSGSLPKERYHTDENWYDKTATRFVRRQATGLVGIPNCMEQR